MPDFISQRHVSFAEADPAGFAHFTSLLRYVEEAEHALLAACGSPVMSEFNGQRLLWPRVRVLCDYQHPARFGDALRLHVSVAGMGRSRVEFRFVVRLAQDGTVCALGTLITACCEESDGVVASCPIPAALREALSAFLDDPPAQT